MSNLLIPLLVILSFSTKTKLVKLVKFLIPSSVILELHSKLIKLVKLLIPASVILVWYPTSKLVRLVKLQTHASVIIWFSPLLKSWYFFIVLKYNFF